LHTMFEIAFDHAWLAGKDFPRERGRALLRLLEALSRTASLRVVKRPRLTAASSSAMSRSEMRTGI